LGISVVLAGQALGADVYRGTAKYTNAKGDRVSTPVTISLDGATPDADRAPLVEKARSDPGAAKALLASKAQLGYIEAVDHRVPIRYAYVIPGGNGQLITVISDEALGYIGGDKSSAKPKEGFDLTYVQLQVDGSGKGRGEMAPACKVKWMESGAPAVEDYGKQVVWVDDVAKIAQP
jgi:hypothetical protein